MLLLPNQEPFNVMAKTSVSMRDPLFYKWHGFLDDLFLEFKDTLTPYTDDEVSIIAEIFTNGKINRT